MGNKAFSDALTFTRASSGSYYAANGDLRIAATNEPRYDYNLNSPLYQNMALYSEQANTWGTSNFSVQSDVAIAPNGTMTADKLVESSAVSVYHAVSLTGGTIISGSVYTISFYIKSAGRSQVIFGFNPEYTTTYQYGKFNLDTGVASVYLGSPTVSMTDVGNGWWRCSTTATATATLKFYPGFQTLNSSAQNQYNGDGVSGVYVWGAQVNIGSTALPYYKTTTTPYNQYNLGGVLVEEQRTNSVRNNSMLGAVAGSPGTPPTNWGTFTALTGVTRQIVGTGVENGVPYLDIRVYGTPSGVGPYIIFWETSTGIAGLTAQTWTTSTFLRYWGGSLTGISGIALTTDEYTSTPTYIRSNSGTPFTATTILTRYSNTFTTSGGATTAYILPCITLSLTGVAVDITLRIGAPQLELGAFTTSLILTSGATATRSADYMTINTMSSWLNSSEGTMFIEAAAGNNTTFVESSYMAISDGTASNYIGFNRDNALSRVQPYIYASTVSQLSGVYEPTSTTPISVFRKIALAYNTNDVALATSGILRATDTSVTLPTGLNLAVIGASYSTNRYLNGWIKSVKYYPKRLTNAELQALTV